MARATAPLWLPAAVALMRFGFRWRVEELAATRARFREIWGEGRRPVLICANHLTLLDSAVIAWALGSPWWYLRRFAALAWNVPERRNFASSRLQRVLVYLMKCVPIERGSDRREVAATLDRLSYLLSRGEAVLIFPEGGRSRTGRIEREGGATYGAGRLVAATPGCRVVCVYLRGERQRTWSALPARGERFHVRLDVLEPASSHRGLRRSLDLSRQVLDRLADMERSHLDAR
ncbi:MAG: lysophospholipid acyltransferase family protein [Thermodesulfobacteriota bacterium]